MLSNKFFILYTDFLSVILLYNFAATQSIKKVGLIGKKKVLEVISFFFL